MRLLQQELGRWTEGSPLVELRPRKLSLEHHFVESLTDETKPLMMIPRQRKENRSLDTGVDNETCDVLAARRGRRDHLLGRGSVFLLHGWVVPSPNILGIDQCHQ